MDDRVRSAVVFVASQLVFLAAVVHVFIGAQKWGEYASYGILFPPDIRWPLFVASGVAVLVGIWLARESARPRRWYLAGAVTMLGFVGAYFLWHLAGHRPLFLVGPGTGHEVTVDSMLRHYFAGPLETVTLTVEVLAASMLLVLSLETED